MATLLFISVKGWSAPAFVQVSSGTANDGAGNHACVTITLPVNVTAGDLIVVTSNLSIPGFSSFSASDTLNGNFTAATTLLTAVGASQQGIQIFYFANSASGSDTISACGTGTAGSNIYSMALEYSGVATTSPVDAISASSGTASTTTNLSLTTTQSNDLIVANSQASLGVTASAPLTSRLTVNSGQGNTADEVVASAGAVTPAFTFTSAQFVSQAVAFKWNGIIPPSNNVPSTELMGVIGD